MSEMVTMAMKKVLMATPWTSIGRTNARKSASGVYPERMKNEAPNVAPLLEEIERACAPWSSVLPPRIRQGVPADPRRTRGPRLPDRRLDGLDDPSPRRDRPLARASRTDLDPVPPVAGVGPDGHRFSFAFPDREFAQVPDVRHQRCGGDEDQPVVMNQQRNGRQRIIICTNRIDAMARNAARSAVNAQQIAARAEMSAFQARMTARASLMSARAAIQRDRNLSEEQRREALEGLSEAEADLAADHD